MPEAIGYLNEIVIDCLDPTRLATFWAAVLGGAITTRDEAWATVREPSSGVLLAFQRGPERKNAKNRLHLDGEVPDLASAVDRSLGLGAAPVGPVVDDSEGSFQVMLDPEGHEFCFVT